MKASNYYVLRLLLNFEGQHLQKKKTKRRRKMLREGTMLFLIHSCPCCYYIFLFILNSIQLILALILCSSRIFSMHSCTTPASNEIPEVASLTILLMFVAVCTRVFAAPMPPSTYHSQPHQKHLVLKVLRVHRGPLGSQGLL